MEFCTTHAVAPVFAGDSAGKEEPTIGYHTLADAITFVRDAIIELQAEQQRVLSEVLRLHSIFAPGGHAPRTIADEVAQCQVGRCSSNPPRPRTTAAPHRAVVELYRGPAAHGDGGDISAAASFDGGAIASRNATQRLSRTRVDSGSSGSYQAKSLAGFMDGPSTASAELLGGPSSPELTPKADRSIVHRTRQSRQQFRRESRRSDNRNVRAGGAREEMSFEQLFSSCAGPQVYVQDADRRRRPISSSTSPAPPRPLSRDRERTSSPRLPSASHPRSRQQPVMGAMWEVDDDELSY